MRVILVALAGAAAFDIPTSLAFGTGPLDRKSVFVVNSGILPEQRRSTMPRQSTVGGGLRRYASVCASILVALLLMQLAACGGGTASADPRPSAQQPPPEAPSTLAGAEGYWSGTILRRCDPWPVYALITKEGRLFASTPLGGYVGSISLEPPFNLTAVNYRSSGLGTPVLDARPDASPIVISSVQPGYALGFRWSALAEQFCDQISTTLRYDQRYERPASPAIISGVYTDGDLTLAVNSDGVVSGSDVNNCVFNGNVAVVHANRNYYAATIDVDNCPGSGRFEGVAFLDDTEAGVRDHVLRLIAANPVHALFLWLEK